MMDHRERDLSAILGRWWRNARKRGTSEDCNSVLHVADDFRAEISEQHELAVVKRFATVRRVGEKYACRTGVGWIQQC